jgi:hypothetical protein
MDKRANYESVAARMSPELRQALLNDSLWSGLSEDDCIHSILAFQAELCDAQTKVLTRKLERLPGSGYQPTKTNWLVLTLSVIAVAGVGFGAGYVISWMNVQKEVNARIDRVVTSQAEALRAELLLESHRGSLRKEPVIGADGEKGVGLVLRPGDLGKPWISADGDAAVVPLQ